MQAVRLPPLPTVRDIVKLYKLRAIKQLSQNFLLDQRITSKIVNAAGNISNHYVCEVGPGPGSITRSIVSRAPKKLIVVEKDERFLPSLELLQDACRNFTEMKIEVGDILTYNLKTAFEDVTPSNWLQSCPPIHLIGNLPFSVSTILLIRWLQGISEKSAAWHYGRTTMTLTFQKEVAERIVAPIAHPQRCRLSVMCQLWCDVDYKFAIPGTAFVPKPDVDVGVVKIIPKKRPLVDLPFKMVEKVIRTTFNMRQKACKRGAQNLFPPDVRDDLCLKLFHLANVNFTIRPFEISNEEFARLCYAYHMLCKENPGIEVFDFRQPKNFDNMLQ